MANYDVKLRGDSHYVIGLVDKGASYKDGDWVDSPDTMLLIRYREGDCDTKMSNKANMHGALYDLLQCHEGLKDGDTFTTEFGRFECDGFHVLDEQGRAP